MAAGSGAGSPVRALARIKNKAGQQALHCAAIGGCTAAAAALRAAAPGSATARDKQGLTPAELATRRGHAALAAMMGGAPAAAAEQQQAEAGEAHTLVLAPPQCLAHFTCPEPIVRGGPDPPPENVNRLKVLTTPGETFPCLFCYNPLLHQSLRSSAGVCSVLRGSLGCRTPCLCCGHAQAVLPCITAVALPGNPAQAPAPCGPQSLMGRCAGTRGPRRRPWATFCASMTGHTCGASRCGAVHDAGKGSRSCNAWAYHSSRGVCALGVITGGLGPPAMATATCAAADPPCALAVPMLCPISAGAVRAHPRRSLGGGAPGRRHSTLPRDFCRGAGGGGGGVLGGGRAHGGGGARRAGLAGSSRALSE